MIKPRGCNPVNMFHKYGCFPLFQNAANKIRVKGEKQNPFDFVHF